MDNDVAATLPESPEGQTRPPATDPLCLEHTSKHLEETNLATADELGQLRGHGAAPLRGPRPWDPLEFLAALRVRDPDARPVEVERLGRALAQSMGQQLALIPFANRMPTPSAFYDVNPGLMEHCQQMMTPVLYAEESEVIGIGSINPVALRLTAQHIGDVLGERTGSRPIISRLLLHHDGWISLCQKQFEI